LTRFRRFWKRLRDRGSSIVSGLANILQQFGEVTGLVTNVAKSSIAHIHCTGINLTEILINFPAAIATFPIKYLGLPLSLLGG
jgi:hypothetical protein